MRARVAVACLALLSGCALKGGSSAADRAPSPNGDWPGVVAQATQEATEGRYGVADRLLSEFTVKYPATTEAAEAMYRRAIYKLDPANPNASAREAGALLDNYLTNGSVPHRSEAASLRRVVTVLEARPASTAAAPLRGAPEPVASAVDKAKDDEIARMKDELARANAELERIKKRLAQPTKP